MFDSLLLRLSVYRYPLQVSLSLRFIPGLSARPSTFTLLLPLFRFLLCPRPRRRNPILQQLLVQIAPDLGRISVFQMLALGRVLDPAGAGGNDVIRLSFVVRL